MKIKTLISAQIKLTERYQKQYQSIVRRAILQHGFNSSAAKEQVRADLDRLAERMVKNGLKLGMRWLKNGTQTDA